MEGKGRATRLKHGLVKLTQFCVKLSGQKWELSNTAKLSLFKSVFVPVPTYGHEW